ncbi:MAG: serine hydrolase [Thermanaerothrix sp.]|uniref:serine hydrolase n=1 Tax=Thermanaerothrix sp. TaxID=2972675 RepID=UPI003C7B5C3C
MDFLQALRDSGTQYAFYLRRQDHPPCFETNSERFSAASLIKVPILLAWLHLERQGDVSRAEWCHLDDEPQVQGAGFAWAMTTRRLTYHDVLLMMITTSDNLCTNLVIRRLGIERLNRVFQANLGLTDTVLQRKLMDFEARARGLDNWISPTDCIRLFDLIRSLKPDERQWVDRILSLNQDDRLLKRNFNPDAVTFCHKTGSIPGVLHDWGYTSETDVFLLMQGIQDERAALELFEAAGELALGTPMA